MDHAKLKDNQKLILLAAGTGVTPMAKLIQYTWHLAEKEQKKRKVLLLLFNKTDKDMTWNLSFDEAMAASKSMKYFSLQVHDILSQDENWKGHKGRVNEDLLKTLIPEKVANEKRLLCMCGPIPFTRECER